MIRTKGKVFGLNEARDRLRGREKRDRGESCECGNISLKENHRIKGKPIL